MPVSRQWVADRAGKVSEEQLKQMIVEMTSVNKNHWSHGTIADTTSGPRGAVKHVMASLARGPLAGDERATLPMLDFGDPLWPAMPCLLAS